MRLSTNFLTSCWGGTGRVCDLGRARVRDHCSLVLFQIVVVPADIRRACALPLRALRPPTLFSGARSARGPCGCWCRVRSHTRCSLPVLARSDPGAPAKKLHPARRLTRQVTRLRLRCRSQICFNGWIPWPVCGLVKSDFRANSWKYFFLLI